MKTEKRKEITRLLKAKPINKIWNNGYTTRKDRRNKKFSPFEMRSGKGRTKIRKYENRKYRRNKLSISPHKKEGVAYQRNIW